MTKHDTAIRRFLCDYCEKYTFAANCDADDFRIILFENLDFGWRAIVINDNIPGLFFNLTHDDLEAETHLAIYRQDTTYDAVDEEAGLTF